MRRALPLGTLVSPMETGLRIVSRFGRTDWLSTTRLVPGTHKHSATLKLLHTYKSEVLQYVFLFHRLIGLYIYICFKQGFCYQSKFDYQYSWTGELRNERHSFNGFKDTVLLWRPDMNRWQIELLR